MTDVPAPLKALVGLVAAALDRLPEPHELPEKAVELPVLAVSAVLQASLRAQQIYAELTARGDEAISQLRGAPDQPPAWASFDEPPAAATPDAHTHHQQDNGVEIVFGAADAALLDTSLLDTAPEDITPNSAQHAAPTGAAGLHGPSAFDLADEDSESDDNDDDRPLGD